MLGVIRNLIAHCGVCVRKGAFLTGRPDQRLAKVDIQRNFRLGILCSAIRRNGVQDVARLTGCEQLVIGRSIPAEHFRGHGAGEEFLHELNGSDGFFRVDGDVFVLVLDGTTERPDKGLRGHLGVDFLAHAKAHLHALLVPNLGAALKQFVQCGRAIGEVNTLPERFAIVGRVWRVTVHKREILVCGGVIAVELAALYSIAVHGFSLLPDITEIHDRLFELRQRSNVFNKVVAATG